MRRKKLPENNFSGSFFKYFAFTKREVFGQYTQAASPTTKLALDIPQLSVVLVLLIVLVLVLLVVLILLIVLVLILLVVLVILVVLVLLVAVTILILILHYCTNLLLFLRNIRISSITKTRSNMHYIQLLFLPCVFAFKNSQRKKRAVPPRSLA